MSIVTRLAKGAPLTFAEMDANFTTIAGLINAGFNYAVDTGTLNTIVITLASPPALYLDGMNFSTKIANTTTSTSTLNVNGLGVKNIYDEYGTLLPAGLLKAGQIYTFVYNSSLNSGIGGFNTYISNPATEPYPATTNNSGTTVGAQLTNLGSTTGATNIGFTATGTGAVAGTVNVKLTQLVTVTDYAANGVSGVAVDPTGVVESSLGFMAAHNALGAGGGVIIIPPGTYKVASGAITFTNPIELRGSGLGSTIIKTNSATGDVLTLNAAYMSIRDIRFDTSVTRTAGSYISMTKNCSNSFIRNFYMNAGFVGITGTCVNVIKISEGYIFGTATGGYGIRFLGDGVTPAGNDIYLNFITISAASNVATAGVQITNNGAINITDCDIIRHGSALQLNPATNGSQAEVATSIWCLNTYFDTSTIGVEINPGAGGTVAQCRFTSCWFSAHSNVGIFIGNSGTTVGLEFISPFVFSNTNNGVVINGGTDNKFLGGGICGTSAGSGVSIAANIPSFSFIGTRIGNGYGKPNNSGNGIFIAAGTSGNFSIIGCDLTGNTGGALVDNGTGTSKNIYGNTGIDPGATTNISVTASPFTYTAGDRPETVYINQGTVSLVTVDGVGVFQSSNVCVRLGAGKAAVVTYTVAPGMAKTIE